MFTEICKRSDPTLIALTGVCWWSYVLATSKVLSRYAPTFDSPHLWQLYSAAPLGQQATSTMSWYPTELTNPCVILVIPNTRIGSNKYQGFGIIRIGQGLVCSVRIMWLSEISGHIADGMISQWGNTIASHSVMTSDVARMWNNKQTIQSHAQSRLIN